VTVVAVLGGCASSIKKSALIAETPIGTPLVVYINGQGPFRFGIDTGQSEAVLVSPGVAAKLKAPVVQRIDASDGTPRRFWIRALAASCWCHSR
jgi:hypothetical protein